MRRPAPRTRCPRIRVERLEDRSVPAFLAAPEVPVGPSGGDRSEPDAIVKADFNGDGRLDLASVSGGFGHLNINLNNGDGTFATPVNYATGFCAAKVVAADFNKDGILDLAVACADPSHEGVSIL